MKQIVKIVIAKKLVYIPEYLLYKLYSNKPTSNSPTITPKYLFLEIIDFDQIKEDVAKIDITIENKISVIPKPIPVFEFKMKKNEKDIINIEKNKIILFFSNKFSKFFSSFIFLEG
jgi:hypothetical protein